MVSRDVCGVCSGPSGELYLFDEDLLIGKLGYNFADLADLTAAVKNVGGLLDDCGGPGGLDVHAGDLVIVALATGHFGGAGVQVALALGARIIAADRNEQTLNRLAQSAEANYQGSNRLNTVQLTNNVDTDTAAVHEAIVSFSKISSNDGKGADKYLDWTPP